MASSTSSPCGACKFLRRKCTPDCIFAPYFPPDQPLKFANTHKVFGASNISKMLHELPPQHRADAVNSLAYEAEARIRDPVYGCVGAVSFLTKRIQDLQYELRVAHSQLESLSSSIALGLMVDQKPSLLPSQQDLSPSTNPCLALNMVEQVVEHKPSINDLSLLPREKMWSLVGEQHHNHGLQHHQHGLQEHHQPHDLLQPHELQHHDGLNQHDHNIPRDVPHDHVTREAHMLDPITRSRSINPYQEDMVLMQNMQARSHFKMTFDGIHNGRSTTSSGEGTSNITSLSSP